MRIENGEDLLDSVAEWKALSNESAMLYIVVPENKLDLAKKLVGATNVRARFASYQLDHNGKVTEVRYE